MSVTFPVTGATYRLKSEVRAKTRITLDVRDHEEAKLVEYVACWDTCVLDKELAGSKVWERSKLAWVRGAKEVEHTQLNLRFSKSLLPAQRRNIIEGGIRNNLDFGFTPTQAAALDALEAALTENEHPCIGHDRRRQCRAAVVTCYHHVLALGLRDALTPRELAACSAEFLGNTVLS